MSYSVDKPNIQAAQQARLKRGWAASFMFAFDGVLRTLIGERNMKVHWVSATAVMLVGMALPLPMSARAALLFAVLLVLATEVLNTAIEGVVNLATDTWAFAAKLAKDAAAGTVLIVAVGAVMLLVDTLFHYWPLVTAAGPAIQRTLAFGLPLLSSMTLLLSAPRQMSWMVFAGCCAGLCWIPLARGSEDPIFSLTCFLFILGAAMARLREPELLNQNPPPNLSYDKDS